LYPLDKSVGGCQSQLVNKKSYSYHKLNPRCPNYSQSLYWLSHPVDSKVNMQVVNAICLTDLFLNCLIKLSLDLTVPYQLQQLHHFKWDNCEWWIIKELSMVYFMALSYIDLKGLKEKHHEKL
jgi:hypothetical protein